MCRTYIPDELINLNNTDNEANIDFKNLWLVSAK